MSDHPHINANYRYIAAYNEINARIGQRQQAGSTCRSFGRLAAQSAVVARLLISRLSFNPPSE